jgi:phospholipid/cholesterol/gamma-HCH transport system substrate-binding protein
MPQRQEIQWAQLRVGIMVTVALIILVVAVFFISGQIGFVTPKYTLFAYFPSAEGLRPGSEVELAGIPAGSIKDIRLSQYREPNRAVEIVLSLQRKFQREIRADSVANETTAGLLGETFLDISRGSLNQPELQNGNEIRTLQEADIKKIEENANDVISNLNQLSRQLNDITNQITQGHGSIGRLLYDETFYNRMNQTLTGMETLVKNLQNGEGTIGKFLVDPTAYNKTVATIDHLNQLVDQIQKGQGTMGRLVSDPALYNQLKDIAAKTNTLLDNINKGQGTLGKLATDQQLYDRMNSTIGHVDNITARMDQGVGTLGKFSTDDTLYKNLSASSASLREFLDAFRKNPRKYLQVRVHIF